MFPTLLCSPCLRYPAGRFLSPLAKASPMKWMALAAFVAISGVALAQRVPEDERHLPGGAPPEFVVVGKLDSEKKVLTIYRPSSIAVVRQQKKLLPVGDKVEEFKQNEVVRRVVWRSQVIAMDSYRLSRADGTQLTDVEDFKDTIGKVAVIVSVPDAVDPAYLKALARDTLVLQSTQGSEKWTVPAD